MSDRDLRDRNFAFSSRKLKVFQLLKHQFETPSKAMRELVQNALAAGATKVSISTSLTGSRLKFIVEDDGEGMSPEQRKKRLLKMGNKGKEGRPDIPGEYGMGFHAVFAYQPEEVIVESRSENSDPWRLEMNEEGYGNIYHNVSPTCDLVNDEEGTYTKISIQVQTDNERDARRLRDEAARELTETCAHVPIPVYFDGDNMSQQPFDLSGPRIRYRDEEGREAVIARERGGGQLELYSHRIKLGEIKEKGNDSSGLPYGYHVLLEDPHLRPVISRNNVKQDKYFHQAVQTVKEEVKLFDIRVFQYLESFLEKRVENGRVDKIEGIDVRDLYQYGAEVLRRELTGVKEEKKSGWIRFNVNEEISFRSRINNVHLFRSASGSYLDLNDILRMSRTHGLYFAPKRSRITERLTGIGWPVIILHHSSSYFLLESIGRFYSDRSPINVNKKFYTPPRLTDIDQRIRGFQEIITELEDQLPRTKILLGKYDEREGIGVDKEIYLVPFQRPYLDYKPPNLEGIYDHLVILNLDRDSIRNLKELAQRQPVTAKQLTGWKILFAYQRQGKRAPFSSLNAPFMSTND